MPKIGTSSQADASNAGAATAGEAAGRLSKSWFYVAANTQNCEMNSIAA